MLNSPCEEVVKLALSGLDRIVFKEEVALYAVRVTNYQQFKLQCIPFFCYNEKYLQGFYTLSLNGDF